MLVKRLAESHRNLAVVGDPDQSIYKWRGADVKNILDFEDDFPETKVVRLERNYRSTQVILDAASAVIRQNKNRKEKRLYTERLGGTPIVYYRGSDDLDEAAYIVRTVREAQADDARATGGGAVPHELAVACARRRAVARGHPVQDRRGRQVLRAQGNQGRARLPQAHHQSARRRELQARGQRPAARHRQGHDGCARGRRSDGLPAQRASRWSPRASTTSRRRSRCGRRWSFAMDDRALPARSLSALQKFRNIIDQVSSLARTETVAHTIATLLEASGYLPDLRDERSEEAEGRIENLEELVSAASEYESRDPEASLGGFVDRLSLLSEADEVEGSATARVWLMTHARGEGPRVPDGDHRRDRGGRVPALPLRPGRRDRRRASPVLRRHHPRAAEAGADGGDASARVRGVPGERSVTLPRRDSRGARREARARVRARAGADGLVPAGGLAPTGTAADTVRDMAVAIGRVSTAAGDRRREAPAAARHDRPRPARRTSTRTRISRATAAV